MTPSLVYFRLLRSAARRLLLCLLALVSVGAAGGQDPPPLDELPWARSHSGTVAPSAAPVTSARQLLVSIDRNQLQRFRDAQPWDDGQEQTLQRILYRLPGFGLGTVDRLLRRDFAWEQLVENPEPHRIEFFHLVGRVKHVAPYRLPSEVASALEYSGYYRVILQLDDSPYVALVCARRIPQAWRLDTPIDHRASATGLFLKAEPASEKPPRLIFAADRVAWHPDRVDLQDGVTAELKLLADSGMDVGLLDVARGQNGKPLGGADRECFYQMLAAVADADPRLLPSAAPLKLAPMLTEPAPLQGSRFRLQGNVRRITRIDVADGDIRQRFGIDHYWQLDVFVPLGDVPVRLGRQQDDRQTPLFNNRFPVTVCTVSLPESLQAAANSNREELNQPIRLSAYFYKVWIYKSQFISSFNEDQRQPSPLLIGSTVEIVESQEAWNPYFATIVGLLFVVVLAGIWIGLWRYSRGDKKFEETTLRSRLRLPPGESLDDLDLPTRDGPDLSHLD